MLQELIKLLYRGGRSLIRLLFGKKKSKMQLHEIGTHESLQKKYGLYAENRPEINLNSRNVPANLKDLIPLAEKWGAGDDIIRSDIQEKSSIQEKLELKEILNERRDDINKWLDSFDGKEMSDEAATFLYMMLGLDEMQL